MSDYRAVIEWQRRGENFLKGRFSREHTWTFDGGVTLPASASPSVVPAPYSSAAAVDPEEAFVAAIASCHMLTFLYLASRANVEVERYEDEAVGVMTKNERGVPWVSTVTLHPKISYSGENQPAPDVEKRLHHEAHEQCFIANSVKTVVIIEPSSQCAV